MALPVDNPVWPPAECQKSDRSYREWGAWYSGDPQELRNFYQVANGFGSLIDPKQHPDSANNLLDRVSRFFWGNPPEQGNVRDAKLHIPLAGDIAGTSADLLFGEPPNFTVSDELSGAERSQARLIKLVDGGLIPVLLETAETTSALGGGYVRVTIDKEMSDTPIFDSIPPESAVPEWRSGMLRSVTFWREVAKDGDKVYRHLELHERGTVQHGLYLGSSGRLGQPVDLRTHPATASFSLLTDDEGRMVTGATGLAAEYVPNMLPNRLIRGSRLGRSDYQGIESTLDALDEAWSSLMRDIRLGKSRLVIPDSYLDSNGAGRGARFNAERELFVPIKAMPGDEGIDLEQVQFNLRINEHLLACRNLAAQALRGAGYAAQSFGEGDQSGPATATEIQARENRSFTTRSRKIEYWRRPLSRLSLTALQMDKAQFGSDSGDLSEVPNIEWPDGVTADLETTARTIQMLDAARALSQRTKVQMVHPQWDDDQVDEEVDLINSDEATEVDVDPNADIHDHEPTSSDEGTPGETGLIRPTASTSSPELVNA